MPQVLTLWECKERATNSWCYDGNSSFIDGPWASSYSIFLFVSLCMSCLSFILVYISRRWALTQSNNITKLSSAERMAKDQILKKILIQSSCASLAAIYVSNPAAGYQWPPQSMNGTWSTKQTKSILLSLGLSTFTTALTDIKLTKLKKTNSHGSLCGGNCKDKIAKR